MNMICKQFLGVVNRQVHGMGLLHIPKQVYVRLPRRFKNMNISTQDTSYEGEADGREEIARLWEHIQKQDLVIEQLRNQQGSHENNETTRVNHFFGVVRINILLTLISCVGKSPRKLC